MLATNEVPQATVKATPVVPVAPPDPTVSILGTDSSLSSQRLELVLIATSPGHSPREGTATLGTDPRNPQTYAAGAVLVNGAVIDEIHRDHVVLARDGKRIALTLGGKTLARSVASQSFSPGSTATSVGGQGVVQQPLDNVPSSREDLSEFLRPVPVFESDELVGLRILPGKNRSRLEALGLQSGDIIRTIEGKPLKSAASAWQTLDDALSTGTSIVVAIERDTTMMSIYLDGSKLAEEPMHVGAANMPTSASGT